MARVVPFNIAHLGQDNVAFTYNSRPVHIAQVTLGDKQYVVWRPHVALGEGTAKRQTALWQPCAWGEGVYGSVWLENKPIYGLHTHFKNQVPFSLNVLRDLMKDEKRVTVITRDGQRYDCCGYLVSSHPNHCKLPLVLYLDNRACPDNFSLEGYYFGDDGEDDFDIIFLEWED